MITWFQASELFALLFMIAIFAVLNAQLGLPPEREALAEVQTIDHENRTLSLAYTRGRGPKLLILCSDTRLLHNGRFVPATELKEGARVTLYYRSPFFGKPFATKVVWRDTEKLISPCSK